MRRSEQNEEVESLRRGSRRSFFINPNQNSGQSKANKSLYTYSMANEFKNFGEHFREANIGDSDISMRENRSKVSPNVQEKSKNEISTKKSKTLVVGHFGKLKKKNEEGMKKYLDLKSKNVEIQQMNSSISKIQAKIDELANAIQSKTSHVVDKKVDPVKENSVEKAVDFKMGSVPWVAVGVATLIVVFVLAVLWLIEKDEFFNVSISIACRSQEPNSWFNWLSYKFSKSA